MRRLHFCGSDENAMYEEEKLVVYVVVGLLYCEKFYGAGVYWQTSILWQKLPTHVTTTKRRWNGKDLHDI